MRKQSLLLFATYYLDSNTLTWHVELGRDGAVWELVNEGNSDLSKVPSEMFAALLTALSEVTVGGSPSMNRSSR